MGEIVASVELENATDRENAREGLRDESTVRRTTVEGVVDTGAVMNRPGFPGVLRHRARHQRQRPALLAD